MSEVNTDKLIEDLRAVIRDAEELLHATAGQAGEQITRARAKAEQSLHSARAMLHAMGEAAAARTSGAVRHTDRYVRTNPWVAVGTGAAVGFFLGMMVGRLPGRPE